MKPTRISSLAALTVGTLATFVLGGCGSSGSGTSPANTVSASPTASQTSASVTPPSTTTPAPSTPTASADLAGIVVSKADLPTGWVAEPYTPDPTSAATQAALLACVGAKNTKQNKTGEVHSDDFHLSDATISSSASQFRSEVDVANDVAVLRSPKISSCYQTLLRNDIGTGLPAGTKITSVSFTVTPGPNGGAQNIAGVGVGKIGLTSGGRSAVVYVDTVFITGSSIEAEADFVSVAAPVPAALRAKITALVAARAAKA